MTRLGAGRMALTLGLALGASACMPAASQRPLVPGQPRGLAHVTSVARQAALRGGTLWQPTDIASLDLLKGPQGDGALAFDTHVTCEYSPPDDVVTGMTPKFQCALTPGDVVKIKYGRKNDEVFSEVAATRLFWALGFGADRVYPVQVTCRNCPVEPWYYGTERRVKAKTYRFAAIERRLPGKKMESRGVMGWEWRELDLMDEKSAPRAHRDALKLLMVFIQNSDNKGPQQRMVCPPGNVSTGPNGDESCEEAFLYVSDLGYSFGRATRLNLSKVDLGAWEKVPVWKDRAHCVGHLKKSIVGTLADPQISEAGRSFLAGLLTKLSDEQIRDLFAAGRFEHRGTSLDEWVRVFKKKRAEIVDHRCPS